MKIFTSLCKTALSAAAVTLFAASSALAGPFGTAMGDSTEKFAGARAVAENVYVTTAMPENAPGFNGYMLNFADGGLCAVSAFADDDKVQENFLNVFTETMEQIVKEHGDPVETLDPIWTGFLAHGHTPQELKAKLHENANMPFGAAWDLKDNADGLASVQLVLLPAGESRCAVILSYFYKNYVDEEAPLAQ